MIVFFTCPTRNILKYSKTYKKIRDEILHLGHKINRDWIDYSINVAQKDIPDIPPETLYKEVMSAILSSDVVVADATVKSMALGHQITFALQKNKPVLILRNIKKNKEIDGIFIEGSESRYLSSEIYSKMSDIPKILKFFFRKYEDKTKKRFNLVLSGSQDSYLNWAAFTYKKSKTEIIHDTLDKFQEKDQSYQKYLSDES